MKNDTYGSKGSDETKEEIKPNSFCETPEEKCTMSYCDENGCINRKRNLVGEPIEKPINLTSSQTEISDEEIQKWIDSTPYYGHCTTEYKEGLEDGIKWYKEKLKCNGNGNK